MVMEQPGQERKKDMWRDVLGLMPAASEKSQACDVVVAVIQCLAESSARASLQKVSAATGSSGMADAGEREAPSRGDGF